MDKFISVTTNSGAECFINTRHLVCVLDKTEAANVIVMLDTDISPGVNYFIVQDTYTQILERMSESDK